MSKIDLDIPDLCFKLLAILGSRSEPTPYRDLPQAFRDIGLLKVCRHRNLIELVLWDEPEALSNTAISPGNVVVAPPPDWLPYYCFCGRSLEDTIARDAECQDPAKYLHVNLTSRGEIVYHEWRLTRAEHGSNRSPDEDDRQPELSLLPPAQNEVWSLLGNQALSAKEIGGKVIGGPISEDAIRKRIASIGKSGRTIRHQPGLGYYRPDAPPKGGSST